MSPIFQQKLNWLNYKRRTINQKFFSKSEIEDCFRKYIRYNITYGYQKNYNMIAMTISQAKNREFDNVFIIWPYRVGGGDEHKRRLLYNGITRAKKWCNIIVQDEQLLDHAPFS